MGSKRFGVRTKGQSAWHQRSREYRQGMMVPGPILRLASVSKKYVTAMKYFIPNSSLDRFTRK